jgi:hypothetical protein
MNTAQLALALGLRGRVTEADVLAAIAKHKAAAPTPPSPEDRERLVNEMITLGIESRRLLRSRRPWAEEYARRDPAGFMDFLEGAPEVGFASAVEEFKALVNRRIEKSAQKLELTAALERVARGHPQVLGEIRSRLEFRAGAAVSGDDVVRELARAHPHLVEQARELVNASGVRMEYGDAMNAVAQDHPELLAEIRDEQRERMAAAAAPRDLQGPVSEEFRRAVEDLMWADGVEWSEAARRVHAARPELSQRLARERGTAEEGSR